MNTRGPQCVQILKSGSDTVSRTPYFHSSTPLTTDFHTTRFVFVFYLNLLVNRFKKYISLLYFQYGVCSSLSRYNLLHVCPGILHPVCPRETSDRVTDGHKHSTSTLTGLESKAEERVTRSGDGQNTTLTGRDEMSHRLIQLQNFLASPSLATCPHLAHVFQGGHQGMKICAQCCMFKLVVYYISYFFRCRCS